MRLGERAYVLAEGEGDAIWFAGAHMVRKASTTDSEGRFTVYDQHVGAGYATPYHVHHDDDEAWYVLEGEVSFRYGDERFTAGPGAWVFLPRNVPHGFRAGPDGARLLTFAAPSGFDGFVQSVGERDTGTAPPPPTPQDVQKMMQLAEQYHLEILGPPEEV